MAGVRWEKNRFGFYCCVRVWIVDYVVLRVCAGIYKILFRSVHFNVCNRFIVEINLT